MPGLPLKNPWTRPIPNPSQDLPNLFACVSALKETVESLIGQRGRSPNRAVTFNDLTAMGVLTQDAIGSPGGSFAPALYQAGPGIAINTGTTPPTISTVVPYLPLTGGTITGRLDIANTMGAGYGGLFILTNTSAGATNPTKFFQISPSGTLQIVNSNYTAVAFQFSDQGNLTLGGPYLYGVNATGGVNGAGGPFIYFDSNYIVAHLGTGNGGFQVQNTAGTPAGGFGPDGWLLSLGLRRTILNDGNYTQIQDGAGNSSIFLGGTADPENYYRNGAHRFQGVGGATYDYYIDAGGITIQNGAIAYRSKKTDGTNVALAYVEGNNNVIIGGYGSGLPCFVGSGGSYFTGAGDFYAAQHVVLKNGFSLFAGNAAATGNYPLIGVGTDNRIKINSSTAYHVDAYGAWTFSSTVFNTNSGAATGAFHMAPNASGTLYGSFWYNDGATTYLLLTNNNDALGIYNGLRPFYVDNATGIVVMGHGLNLSGGPLQLAGVSFAAQDATYHYLYDKSGRAAILLGGSGDSSNIYRNSAHSFVGINGAGGTQLKVDGSLQSLGANGGYFFADRTSGGLNWGVYATDTLLHFWNSGHADIATMDSVGNLFLLNGNFLYGRQSNGTDLQLCGVADRNYFGNGTLDTHIRATTWCYFSGHPVPIGDNAYYCGYPGSAWNQVFSYAYPGPSDVRLKHEIEDLPDDCLDLVRAITPRRYKFHNAPEKDRDRKRWGFIAQEVAEAMAARGHDFGGHFIGDDPAQSQALDHSDLLAVLWHAVKELAARVAALETKS